jgi:hypothetical protein
MNSIETALDQATTLLEKLYGLPAIALVLVSCIFLGYILRVITIFPNKGIPLAVILWGGVFFPAIADATSNFPFRVWLIRNLLMGLMIGVVAWLLHNQVLSRLEDRLCASNEAKTEGAPKP